MAAAMRTQFEANESRGGWREIRAGNIDDWFKWLRANVDTLEQAVKGEFQPGEVETLGEQHIEIAARAADVANLAAIIAQNAGSLKMPEDHENVD